MQFQEMIRAITPTKRINTGKLKHKQQQNALTNPKETRQGVAVTSADDCRQEKTEERVTPAYPADLPAHNWVRIEVRDVNQVHFLVKLGLLEQPAQTQTPRSEMTPSQKQNRWLPAVVREPQAALAAVGVKLGVGEAVVNAVAKNPPFDRALIEST